MTTREEIAEDIRELEGEIVGLETQLKEMRDKDLILSIDAKITAKTGLLTIKEQRLLVMEQQGTFLHIFPLFFPNLLDVIFAQSLSTSPLHPFRFGDCSR